MSRQGNWFEDDLEWLKPPHRSWVRVVDKGYVMGVIFVQKTLPYDSPLGVINRLDGRVIARRHAGFWGEERKIRVRNEDRRRQIRLESIRPSWVDEYVEENREYLEEKRKSLNIKGAEHAFALSDFISGDVRKRIREETRHYVVFPGFSIRAEKLKPIVKSLLLNDINVVEFSFLKKCLKM